MKGQPLQLRFLGLFSLLLLPFFSLAQHLIQVIDEQDIPLPGVQLYSSDLSINMLSDIDGWVTLSEDLDGDKLLTISYTGYTTVSKSISELRRLHSLKMESGILMDEIIVVGRTNTASDKLINSVTSISDKEIRLSNPQTAADAIGQHSDVFIQKSQMGGGSPIVRGFEANKVLLVVDGVRLNNAIYRSGHLQNAITIDNQIMDRIEVIYGPGSLMYGSDALGGVVQFRTRDPKINFEEASWIANANFMTRFASANQEQSLHADVEVSGRKMAFLSSISYSSFGDLKSGARRNDKYPDFGKRFIYAERINGQDQIIDNEDPNVQVGTAYKQFDFLQKIKWAVSKEVDLIANIQFSTSSDIPRYDRLIETDVDTKLAFAEWYYGPQDRFLGSLRGVYRKPNRLFDHMITIASYQQIGEDRIDRQFGNNNQAHQEELVHVSSLTIDFSKSLNNGFVLDYGVDFNHNALSSKAYSIDIESQEISQNELSRYPDGKNSTRQIAAYLLFKKLWNTQHNLTGGLRYNFNQVSLQYERTDLFAWPSAFTNGLVSNNRALTASLGYKFTDNGWTFRAMSATAFRAPNIDDIAKIRVKVDEVSVPNLSLKPEKSWTSELSLSKSTQKGHRIGLTAFYTHLKDAVVRSRGTLPDGSDILIDNGDTLLTFVNTNASSAKLFGLSLNGKAQLHENFSIQASWNWVEGRQTNGGEEQPLSHIPPKYGKVDLKYETKLSSLVINSRFNAAKPLSEFGDSTDNPELATPEGSLGWYTINLYANHALNERLSVNIGLENLLDQHYRPFASGVSGAGRNFIVSLRAQL